MERFIDLVLTFMAQCLKNLKFWKTKLHKKSLPKLIQMNIFLDLMNGIGKFTVLIHLAYKANLHKKDSVNFIFRRCQCVSLKNKVILLNLKTFENEGVVVGGHACCLSLYTKSWPN